MDETTLFFARIAAAYFAVTGLGFLISTEFYEKMVQESGQASPVTLNLSGAVHFLVGLAILLQHFRWGNFVEALITLIGIAALFKGAALIIVPALTLKSPKTGKTALRISGVVFLTLGVYLGIVGFFSWR